MEENTRIPQVFGMTIRKEQLDDIYELVSNDSQNVSKETRKEFWKLVRDIKRSPSPDSEEIIQAARIRNILFQVDRGGTYPLAPIIALETVLGLLSFTWGYIWSLRFPLDWTTILTWDLAGWGLLLWRFFCVMLIIFFFYPWGRFIGAKWAGIKLDGMVLDQYYEPTLKIDYVTFLNAAPAKRKWFFFIAGIWTVITALVTSFFGILLGQDYTPLIVTLLLFLFEMRVIASGSSSPTGGEMGHYNREKKIERVWREKVETGS